MNHVCKNCGSHYKGNFCSECGQKHNVSSFTFKHIFQEAFHAFTHADKSFLVMVKKLVLNPGKVAYEFIIEGRRKKYYNPFAFFVVITAIAAFIQNKDLAIKEAVFHDNNEYGHVFNVYSKVLSLIAIPLIAFIIWLLHFKKPRLRYSEYTVFAMMLMALKSIVDIFTSSISYFSTALFKKYFVADDNLLYAALVIAYIAYANYEFHKKMKKSSLLQSALTGIGFIIVQVAIAMFVVWAILRDFHGLGIFSMFGISFKSQ